MSEANQLPSQPTTAALPEEAQPTNNNPEETPKEETGSTRVMTDNNIDPNNITYGTIGSSGGSSEKKSERKEYLESLVTSGLQHHQQHQEPSITDL